MLLQEYMSEIQAALKKVPDGSWREFAAFAGPELAQLSNWDSKVVLVGDSSHALSGAFGAGAGFAMEDGWVIAQALRHSGNDRHRALALFDRVRVPYYHRMYEWLDAGAKKRAAKLAELGAAGVGVNGRPSEEERVKTKIIKEGGDMSWIYQHNIANVWESTLDEMEAEAGR